ncbi:peptidoglycan editing factor PgeF [Sinimarinibacterium thermocellulolyticum]|uniref:Purine nucleoside phosphorylase n=1 Tax=Sinimarinibacterium thermocellulolyticum TaxID=3170016 RepID=A0ABV2A719_9GAMM
MNPGLDVLIPQWPAPARVRALQTQRSGGVSQGPFASLNLGEHVGDVPAHVAENRRRLQALLPDAPQWLCQVHGTAVVRLPCAVAQPMADAAWTDRPGVVCAVQTADCLPVLLCSDDGAVVAAAHAGWRGLADGVLEAVLAALPCPAARVLAWLGPAIGADAFEVGPEVRERFLAADAGNHACFRRGAGDRWYADLFALARGRLRACGVRAVHGGGLCTVGDPRRWFSHRRDGRCGRMASLIWIDRD